MIIAIDNSPIVSSHKLADKIRGTGFYIKNLTDALQKYHPEHTYVFFTQGETVPKADIYHYPYFEPFFLSLPSKKPGKMVITIHDLTPLVFPKLFPVGIKGKIKFVIQKRRSKNADAIITDSDSSKKDINKIIKIAEGKIHSIPLAPAAVYKKMKVLPTEKRSLVEKYKIPEKFALYVGDATPNKNLKNLVDAAILGKFPLVMVGGALVKKDVSPHPWNKELLYVQKMAEESPHIFLPGYVSDLDLALLYNTAEVFVFPSLYEGFGLPLLEAATCGAAIVTTEKGSIPEVIDKAALYVDSKDVESIANGVRQVLENKNIQIKLAKEALLRSAKFSWRKTAKETVRVYEEIYHKS